MNEAWFFNSPQGAKDAAAELHATLDALLDNRLIAAREEPARCVFGARLAWLASRLGGPLSTALAAAECPRRSQWLQALDAQKLWLVFPSGYLNSPASMFGHTLLRIDSRESLGRGPLLAYAANFVADTAESNGLVFAVKGLTGGYVGRYGVLPYYEKVREYVRMESRDLWEYPLHLDTADQQRLLLHLWELRGVAFDYYFFSRNCAYQLLALLQPLRPEQDWLSGFTVWAAPTDTIRVLQQHGLLGAPSFRPALRTHLQHRAAQLSEPQRRQAAALSHGQMSATALSGEPARDAARVLDVAHDLTYLRYQAGGDRDALLAIDRALLSARAATGVTSEFTPVPTPAVAPDRGHGTQRWQLGGTATHRRGQGLWLLGYRPGYHDLLDAPGGYTEGSQVHFGNVLLRLNPANGTVGVEQFKFIDIVSLAPRDTLLQPISWRLSTGARRALAAEAPLRAYLEAAPTAAWGKSDALWFAALPLRVESSLRALTPTPIHAGVELGALAQLSPQWRGLGQVGWQAGLTGQTPHRRSAALGVQWDATAAWSLRWDSALEDFAGDSQRMDARSTLTALRYF